SSSAPCRDGSVKRISMPIAAGCPRPTMSRNLAWTARGQGQARFRPSKSSSSIVTTTMGEAGSRGPRTENCASRALSSAISKKRRGLTAASTTTARPARLPARSTRQEAARDRTGLSVAQRKLLPPRGNVYTRRMRVRSILLAAFWVAMFIWVGYNGMQAVSSYFQTNDIAEQAFRDASDKQRQRNPGELISSDFLADLRTGVLADARQQGVQLDPATLKI